jgi:hypothetical protein
MTQYVVFGEDGTTLAVKAVSYEVKIVKVDMTNFNDTLNVVSFYRHTGSTLSGGNSVGIFTMRGESPAPTALCRTGSPSFSGTAQHITNVVIPGESFDSTNGNSTGTGAATLQTPLDLTIEPGTVFEVSGLSNTRVIATLYFEELRLSQSY